MKNAIKFCQYILTNYYIYLSSMMVREVQTHFYSYVLSKCDSRCEQDLERIMSLSIIYRQSYLILNSQFNMRLESNESILSLVPNFQIWMMNFLSRKQYF